MSGKDVKALLLEYVSSLSDDKLQFLTTRLVEKLSGDLAEAIDEMSKDKKVDDVLSNAGSSENLYNLLDLSRDFMIKEIKKRDLPSMV